MASTSKTIRGLSAERLKLLQSLLGSKAGAAPRELIPRRSLDGPVPLSFAQHRMWFLDQLEPGSPLYNLPGALRLRGTLNVAALQQSLCEIVRRHEALRTIFCERDGQPMQTVVEPPALLLPLIDLQGLNEDQREALADRLRIEESERPFDLTKDLLLRVTLLRLAPEDHVLLLTMHHIASDGWSIGILIDELALLYPAFSRSLPSPLAPLPLQYADFALWQRERLQGEVLDQQLSYWREHLKDAPVLELPTDYPRPPVQTYRGALFSHLLSPALSSAINVLSQRLGLTLYMTLLAAFQLLLARYSGHSDIAVGTIIAGRNRREVEPLIGFFVNTLVMRTQLSRDETLLQLLDKVREVCLSAYAHQDVPFEKLVEELQPERDLSRSALFQAMLVLQNTPLQQLQLPGLELSGMGSDTSVAKLDLLLSVIEGEHELQLHWEYNRDLFSRESLARLSHHYERVLEAMVEDVEQVSGRVELLSADEREQLREWNETESQYETLTIVELFERQVRENGQKKAVEDESGRSLSYQQLNERANQLAHYLRKKGVREEERVGVCLERTVEMVVGLLAVLKAAAAYVPIEGRHPAERIEQMVRDAGVRVVVTQEGLKEKVTVEGVEVVSLEAEREEIGAESKENPQAGVRAENVAYVIYTSGSTGRPKGVMVEHRNVAALLAGLYPRLSLDANEVWTMCHSYAFDFSVWELWGALLSGARLLIVSARTVGSPVEFRQLLKERGVTLLSLTPSAMSHLIKEVGPRALNEGMALRQLVVGGEAMPRELAVELLQTGLDIWNIYGPTETTVWVAIHPVVEVERTIPIGPPISNSQLYVLDAWQQQVPVGVVGELYIGGDNVSRGYLNHPGLTAEKFVPHPFGSTPGARLYATGDLARFLPHGEVEFLGRADQQVKIRGYRIETGEIEATLAEHPSVRDCVVVAQGGQQQQGARRLVAYIVPASLPAPSVAELREALRQRLPEYMIPSAWVMLDQIPLTRNGKVDRLRLAAADYLPADLTDAYAPPRTPVEELLAGIWQQLLNLPRVGINDNFFELGGHSLLATQLISRLRALFSVEVGLRSLFEHPTVSGLAEVVEQAMRAAQSVTAPPIVHRSRVEGEELPLSFAQQRLWFLDQLEPGSSAYNIPASVRLSGLLDVQALEGALGEIVKRHESLRTTFKATSGQPVQLVSPARPLSLPLIDLQELDEKERAAEAHRLMEEEARRPFDLTRGPLLRASLLRLGPEEHIVLLTMHHIISDGWSMTIVLREVAALYEAFKSGKPSPLPELPVQYPDFTLWQREWFSGEELEKQLAYWRQHLSGNLPVLALPTDRPRSAALTHRGAHETLSISPALHGALARLSQAEGATVYMTTLAAFYILLSRYTGQEDVIVGTDVANRNRSETEPLIGFFVNQLVLRANLSGNPPFREFLKQVREVTLLAYAHQDVPFEKLVETLNPDRAASRTPLFQAKIAFQNGPAGQHHLKGLVLSPLNVGGETGMAKFDLMLNLVETDGGLQVSLEYSSDLFDAATVRRMLRNYETLLGSIAAHPEAPVGQLEMLGEAERKELEAERLRREESKLKKFQAVKPRAVSLQSVN